MRALFNKLTRHKSQNSNQDLNNNNNTPSNTNPNPLREKIVLPPLVCTTNYYLHPTVLTSLLQPQWPPQPDPKLQPPLEDTLPPLRSFAPDTARTLARNSVDNNHLSLSTTTTTPDKKVAFISPSHTPDPSRGPLSTADAPDPQSRPSDATASRTNLSRASGKFIATVPMAGSPRAFTPRQYSNEASSLRSGSPYSQSANSSRILAAPSWSAAAEEDLVSNLGPRERTRQEVLWEIVASEER